MRIPGLFVVRFQFSRVRNETETKQNKTKQQLQQQQQQQQQNDLTSIQHYATARNLHRVTRCMHGFLL